MMTVNALDLCNCCDVETSDLSDPAGYCDGCREAAKTGTSCWHDAG